jgi:hypothetical protein
MIFRREIVNFQLFFILIAVFAVLPVSAQNSFYHPDDIKVPDGAINPAFAPEEPDVSYPGAPGIWPGLNHWPRGHNDTTFQGHWKIYIKSWDSDPPNTVWMYIYNDSPNLQQHIKADLQVNTGWQGENGGFWPEHSTRLQGLEFKQGMTKIPVNIHHIKGQIIRASLTNAHEVTNIKLFNLGEQ